MHVLILNTHLLHAEFLRKALRYENIGADLCRPENLQKIWYSQYEAIIFPLPRWEDRGFLRTLKLLKSLGNVPILFLPQGKMPESIVRKIKTQLLRSDILPFEEKFEKILKKLRECFESNQPSSEKVKQIISGDLEINLEKHRVKRGKRIISLCNKEFELLVCLAKNQGKALTRTYLLETVWDRNTSILSNTVDVHINRLRRKIDREEKNRLIHTIPCIGYTLRKSQE